MFVSVSGYSAAPERCFTRVGSGFRKYKTRLERLARDNHSSLLLKSVNYGRNKFCDTFQELKPLHPSRIFEVRAKMGPS